LLLYYITDRIQLGANEEERCRSLLLKISEAAAAGVDYIQLRERDLTARKLERLAQQAVRAVRAANSTTKLLINSRIDIALEIGADGVHLRSNDVSASEARAIWAKSSQSTPCVIAVSCHTLQDVLSAESHGADFAVVGPIFGKTENPTPPTGVEAIARVTRRGALADPKVEAGQTLTMPVLALGGVTLENAILCLNAGAAGIAAIRLFQQGSIAEVVNGLRSQPARYRDGKSS
jgi:thiamine-phosphate pyrophosphorylase